MPLPRCAPSLYSLTQLSSSFPTHYTSSLPSPLPPPPPSVPPPRSPTLPAHLKGGQHSPPCHPSSTPHTPHTPTAADKHPPGKLTQLVLSAVKPSTTYRLTVVAHCTHTGAGRKLLQVREDGWISWQHHASPPRSFFTMSGDTLCPCTCM